MILDRMLVERDGPLTVVTINRPEAHNALEYATIAAGWRYPAMERMLSSEDAIEGPSAFAEKRMPRWSGR